jgi:TRAP-type mannitol/chloroaromatic compound transport system permease small subunit
MRAKGFADWIDVINEWVGRMISFLIIPMTLITTIEVILRYVFNRPTIWAWDVNMMLLGAFTVLTGGYTLLKGGHVAMDIFVSRLSLRIRALLALITSVLFFFSIGLLVWQGGIASGESFMTREQINSIWGPPLYPLKLLWPVGAFLLLLQGVAIFIRDLKEVQSREAKHQ